jgi:hypothetical protein
VKGIKKGPCPDTPPIRYRKEIKREEENSLPQGFLFFIKESVNSAIHIKFGLRISK